MSVICDITNTFTHGDNMETSYAHMVTMDFPLKWETSCVEWLKNFIYVILWDF